MTMTRSRNSTSGLLQEQGLSDTADLHQAERNVVINRGSSATPGSAPPLLRTVGTAHRRIRPYQAPRYRINSRRAPLLFADISQRYIPRNAAPVSVTRLFKIASYA